MLQRQQINIAHKFRQLKEQMMESKSSGNLLVIVSAKLPSWAEKQELGPWTLQLIRLCLRVSYFLVE